MRVIAGSARRLLLKTIDGIDTRPTTDRIKETLFNMLSPDLADCNFLDLFSGSGGIGIEALSRGAKLAVFIERNPVAAACIRENLATTKLETQSRVITCDVIAGLRRLEDKGHVFDLVFLDPPYDKGHEKTVLEYLAASSLVDQDSMIIVEASKETAFDYVESLGLSLVKIKEYKTNRHAFIAKGEK